MHLPDLLAFLSELQAHNTRAWFAMNKPRFDILRAEFEALVGHLVREIGAFDAPMQVCDPHQAVFRIYRDVRFAQDKSPYKTYFSASMLPSGQKRPGQGAGPAYYLRILHDGTVLCGAGEYRPPPARLNAIRAAIMRDPDGFSAALGDAALRTLFGGLAECEMRVRVPKAWPADSPLAPFLRRTHFALIRETALEDMDNAALRMHLLTHYQAAAALVRWLRTA